MERAFAFCSSSRGGVVLNSWIVSDIISGELLLILLAFPGLCIASSATTRLSRSANSTDWFMGFCSAVCLFFMYNFPTSSLVMPGYVLTDLTPVPQYNISKMGVTTVKKQMKLMMLYASVLGF
jgi:hypothetical protein